MNIPQSSQGILSSPPQKETLSDDNRVVQGFWHGDALTPLEIMCIRSFIAHGHDFHHTYNDIPHFPTCFGHQLSMHDAEEILPEKK